MYFFAGLTIGLAIAFFIYKSLQKKVELIEEEKKAIASELNEKEKDNIRLLEKVRFLTEKQDALDKSLERIIEAKLFEAMDKTNKTLLTLADQKIKDDLEKHAGSIEKVIEPLKEQLNNYQKSVKELFRITSENFGSINESVEKLEKLSQTLHQETSKLAGALTNSKVRGRWGEIMLKRIVEYAGMLEHVHFEEQKSAKDKSRPDLIIYLPSDGKIIVDSKAPLENYMRYTEAHGEQRDIFLQKHISDLTNQIKKLASKEYWSKFDGSIDFVVMFIPVEPAYTVAVEKNPDLMSDALAQRVIIATPTTLVALLQTIAFNWQQMEFSQNMKKILNESQTLIGRFATFSGHLSSLGSSLSKSVENFNKAVASWHTMLEPQFEKIKQLGIRTQKEIKNINAIDELPRSTQK